MHDNYEGHDEFTSVSSLRPTREQRKILNGYRKLWPTREWVCPRRLHPGNLLAPKSVDGKVILIDFDEAGKVGTACYPPNLNIECPYIHRA